MTGYKTYKTFDDFFADQAADKREVITALRKFVSQVAPDLTEGSRWGNGVWFNADLPIVFVHVEKDHVQFGFFGGSMLDDPDSVLEGSAKYVRHIKIRSPEDIDSQALTPLVQQAAKTDYKAS